MRYGIQNIYVQVCVYAQASCSRAAIANQRCAALPGCKWAGCIKYFLFIYPDSKQSGTWRYFKRGRWIYFRWKATISSTATTNGVKKTRKVPLSLEETWTRSFGFQVTMATRSPNVRLVVSTFIPEETVEKQPCSRPMIISLMRDFQQ